jgi:hypothetical protein
VVTVAPVRCRGALTSFALQVTQELVAPSSRLHGAIGYTSVVNVENLLASTKLTIIPARPVRATGGVQAAPRHGELVAMRARCCGTVRAVPAVGPTASLSRFDMRSYLYLWRVMGGLSSDPVSLPPPSLARFELGQAGSGNRSGSWRKLDHSAIKR